MSLATVDEVRVYFRRKWRRPKTQQIWFVVQDMLTNRFRKSPIPQVLPKRESSIRRRVYRKASASGSGSDGLLDFSLNTRTSNQETLT